ncbi:MAG: altronate dehydratase family protein [Mobilitalea sp.]
MQEAIKIQEADNVAVALENLSAGQAINIGQEKFIIIEEIPVGHKFALEDLRTGSEVIKYGYSIGKAIQPIRTGAWVHTHNLKTGLGEVLKYHYNPSKVVWTSIIDNTKKADNKTESVVNSVKESEDILKKTEDIPETVTQYFEGFRRDNGKVGIRNEIWIIPTVGCVNDIARLLEKKGREYLNDEVEELVAFTHPYGCSQLGEDHKNTQKILCGLIEHSNAGGILVLGLGCENNNVDEMKKQLGTYDQNRVKFLICQECEDEIEQGTLLIKELISHASKFKREKINVNELVIGLKCGGSDGLSGITANPVVGAFSDLLIAYGGTTILTEVPEMFGAETILMNRCADHKLFEQTVELINNFKQYFIENNQLIYENPSPGNKKGGISTLEDKSLGCTQKSGTSPVRGVLKYGEQVSSHGLTLLAAPGNDLVAATALAASGAHIILFTTGRGTPFGAPVPTIKISSNTALAVKKKNWIDFDAGHLLENKNLAELSVELYQLAVATASGKKVKSEENGFRDIAIFKQGVTL